ncbi:hypothetical protein [Dysgonomonas sp. HGC4]|uniref:hypothetical protein n=1 Tax=Dysgonomonas sp. HGC4 TaxID=1658009 RepID=UPI000682E115|nr:hypothetical protein [Dysgonomonas sp. HGC4]MBD8347060.1 hypothetical protein [Dysgonomonas sp. HGC4]
MKKKVLFSLCIAAASGALQAQVGVNNTDPKASLHITPQKTDGTTAEGIIAPNLTRAQLIGKDIRYTTAQKGAIVYVTAVDGTISPKTTKITTVGYYYFDGAVWQPFSQAETIVPTEPWQVQGGTTAAISNAQNIYQTGSVAIGTGASAVSGYKLDVNGSSNTSGNSRVGSSTVVGAQTVGTTLGVTGATTLASTLNVAGATTIASTGNFTLAGNGAGAGKYLASDAAGKGTWTALPAATVTTANNGLTMSGTTTELGGALSKATTISGTAANTLTVSAPSIISGALRISSGTPAAGKFLASDAAGNATWGTLPVTATTEPWQVQGGAVAATTNAQNIYQTGSVGIGASTAVPAAYKLQVTGDSNVTGNSRVGSSTVVGAQTVAGTSTLTGNVGIGIAPSTQKLYVKTAGTAVAPVPAVRITDGSQGFGKVLTSDADGIAHWEYARLRIVEGVKSTKAVTFPLKYDATVTTGDGIALQSGSSITLPPGRWAVAVKTLISIYDVSAKTNLTSNDFAWVRSTFVDSPTVSGAINQIKSVDIEGAYLISGRVSGPKPINKKNNACWGMMDGLIVINNSTNANKTYYYIVGAYDTASNYAQSVVELRVRVDGLESSITASSL